MEEKRSGSRRKKGNPGLKSGFCCEMARRRRKPKISVIVPYKDSEKWLEGCAGSLIRQEADAEFIFVDDGSQDDGRKILESMKDKRCLLVENEHAQGVSGARNTGLDYARGEWVTFLDADDEMLPGAFRLFGFMMVLDDTINMVQANHIGVFLNDVKQNRFANDRGMYYPDMLPRSWCMVWNKLYRRSFIEEHHIRFKEGVQYGEDELFNLVCLNYDGRILCTQARTCTVLHRYNNFESLSHKKTATELLQQTREMEDYILECDSAEVRMAICRMMVDRWSRRMPEVFK